MLTQIENTPNGYIVGAYLRDSGGNGHWHRLRNFGERQGDAICFRDYDLPDLSYSQINMLAKQFSIKDEYVRIGKNRYRKSK